MEEQPLIKDASENEDQQWDSENRVKRKKEKFYINKKRRKQNERRKYKTHVRKTAEYIYIYILRKSLNYKLSPELKLLSEVNFVFDFATDTRR